jgi:hypothetical protein
MEGYCIAMVTPSGSQYGTSCLLSLLVITVPVAAKLRTSATYSAG